MDADALTQFINNIEQGIAVINQALDIFVPAVVVTWLIWELLKYTRNKIKKEGIGKGVYFGALALFETSSVLALLFIVQWILVFLFDGWVNAGAIRWVLIYLVLIPGWYWMSRKNSGKRGAMFLSIILTTFLIGWLHNKWVGILFTTLPILILFWHIINSYAEIIIPFNEPDNKDEKRQKTQVFLKYLFGIQYPIWVAATRTERTLEKHIEGNNIMVWGKPGILHTWSHQVAGLSIGPEFNRVEGPGIVYTKPFENPIALVDLRTQIRVSHIGAVTKDGMEITVVVFAAFAINREKLPKRMYAELRRSTGRNFEINHPDGSYSYSSGRIYSLLSTSGINTTPTKDSQKLEFFWDDWVVKQIEHAAREVVSDRTLDELWRPKVDGLRLSALDEMAVVIKDLLSVKLTEAGINLYAVRVVNYDVEEESHIAQQNIKTWSSYWEQKVTEANADVEMTYREEIENAHAYAKSILLGVVTESMNEARKIHEDLPRYVIAQYYIHALEEYIKKQPGLDIEESKQRLETIKDFLMYNRTEGSE